MRNCLPTCFLFFFEFFTENVLKPLLRGRGTTGKKKYLLDFQKFIKYVFFFFSTAPDRPPPSTIHHPPLFVNIKIYSCQKLAICDHKLKLKKRVGYKREWNHMEPHRGYLKDIPPRGIRKFRRSKKDDFRREIETQKSVLLGEDIR